MSDACETPLDAMRTTEGQIGGRGAPAVLKLELILLAFAIALTACAMLLTPPSPLDEEEIQEIYRGYIGK